MQIMINMVQPKLLTPDKTIIQKDDKDDKKVYFIAQGQCDVQIKDNMK